MASYKKKFENVTRGEAWGLSEYQEGEPLLSKGGVRGGNKKKIYFIENII